ncbi:MAG: hypothetical protein J0H57_28605, partial [Rhodospirillales bacterium]|nr:hypothetical protein [Rhodospirillales bacterium]
MAKAFGAGIIQLQEKCEVCGLLVNSPVGIIHSEQGKIVSSIVYLNDADLTGFATHCKHRTVDATSRFPSCEVLTARIAEKWAFRSVPTPSRPSPRARLDLQSMLHAFQSIGDNCEYGFVQRWAGAEPLDLLRFAGFAARPEHRLQLTIAALEAGFEGLGAEGSVTCELQGSNQQREFIVRENRWNLSLHTGKHEGEVDPLALPREQQRVLSFKRRELLEDLRTAHRPFLWKADSGNAEGEIRQLVQCLRAYGPNLLLWVRLSDAEHSAEMVEYAGEGLLIGYASRFAPYEAVEEIDLASWHTLIPRAWRASGLLRLLGEWGGDHRKPEPPLAEVDISDTADATAEFEPAGQVGETGPVSIGLSFRDDADRAWMQERPSSVIISTFRISNALLD